jgi:hypothetical protein
MGASESDCIFANLVSSRFFHVYTVRLVNNCTEKGTDSQRIDNEKLLSFVQDHFFILCPMFALPELNINFFYDPLIRLVQGILYLNEI